MKRIVSLAQYVDKFTIDLSENVQNHHVSGSAISEFLKKKKNISVITHKLTFEKDLFFRDIHICTYDYLSIYLSFYPSPFYLYIYLSFYLSPFSLYNYQFIYLSKYTYSY